MSNDTRHLKYRGEIDGLRAIAVLSVVFYHFGLPLRGGFVGVDVFLVISGFLIGGILWRELQETGHLRLGAFYVRRFRRLAPAFFAVLAATFAVGWLLLLPFEFRELGKSAIAATVYLSNVLFFRQSGYFDASAHDKPLLHTWSLAVEEQFYILLPLLMLLFLRRPRQMVAMLALAWGASLAACVWLTPQYPTATFYLFPFRAWELLTGVLLAIWGQSRGTTWTGWRGFSWAGLALVLISVATIPAGPNFPGLLAVVPVLGTALILSSGTNDGTVNRLLRKPALRFVGLMSYSLYLWHWPVYTLSNTLRDGYAGPAEALIWMALSFLLAFLSWRFIERPVRRAWRLPGGVIVSATGLATIGALAVSVNVFLRDGLPDRFGPEARVHVDASADFLQDFSRCYTEDALPLDGLEVCPIGPVGPPRVLIWGDSHARAFHDGLAQAAEEADVPAILLWRAGCPPLVDLRKVESAATPAQDTACRQANTQVRQGFGRLSSIDTVLLIGRWGYYAEGKGIGFDAGNAIALYPTQRPERVGEPQGAVLAEAAEATVAQLDRFFPRVFVLRQPPEIPRYDSRRAAREAAHRGLPLAAPPVVETDVDPTALLGRSEQADAPWMPLVAAGRVQWIDPWPRFCDATRCSALAGGVGQYFDNNHVTNNAARRVRDLFAPVFRGALRETALSGATEE
ncbi:acyltransferase family protein [Sagittula salina]|uniref:Acyltransferase n=1 Tax=Sagittula salina TaxID=2820268 RepID=A0A940MUR1_9RHOB|nr:acyltransferase family protein [Sagittula salina]MBP0484317.1 acyltransferase [Sagittula salina]